MKHIDDFIDEEPTDLKDRDVKQWFAMFRKPAVYQPTEWLRARLLVCYYEGERYRVTGASRMGDVWLTSNFAAETGYDKRVDVALCSGWDITVLNASVEPRGMWYEGPDPREDCPTCSGLGATRTKVVDGRQVAEKRQGVSGLGFPCVDCYPEKK